MECQFIQDVEAFAKEIAVRLSKTREGGIIIMATDSNKIMKYSHTLAAKKIS